MARGRRKVVYGDRWLASCPRVPKLPPPLLGVSIILSLATRSCVAKRDPDYPRYSSVPPRRSHHCK